MGKTQGEPILRSSTGLVYFLQLRDCLFLCFPLSHTFWCGPFFSHMHKFMLCHCKKKKRDNLKGQEAEDLLVLPHSSNPLSQSTAIILLNRDNSNYYEQYSIMQNKVTDTSQTDRLMTKGCSWQKTTMLCSTWWQLWRYRGLDRMRKTNVPILQQLSLDKANHNVPRS